MTKQSKGILAAIVLILAVIGILIGNSLYRGVTVRPTEESVPPDLVSATASIPTPFPVTPGTTEALAQTSGCLECHGMDQKIIGPSFQDIAAKYKGDSRARAALIETVKQGGKGNWTEVTGGVLMPPYSPRLSDAEIEQLVDWLLDR